MASDEKIVFQQISGYQQCSIKVRKDYLQDIEDTKNRTGYTRDKVCEALLEFSLKKIDFNGNNTDDDDKIVFEEISGYQQCTIKVRKDHLKKMKDIKSKTGYKRDKVFEKLLGFALARKEFI